MSTRATRPRPPKRMQTGWCRFQQFPTKMGIKINPGARFYAKSSELMVAIAGPRHDRRTGIECSVRSVSGNLSRVVWGERLETYAHPPISFYKFKRISFKPRRAQSERNDPPTEAEAVRRAAS
jgi:hypothetical protein